MVCRGRKHVNSPKFSCTTSDSIGNSGDMRLERRLKRRSVAWRGLKNCKRETKTSDSCEVVTIVVDDDEDVDSSEEKHNAQGNSPAIHNSFGHIQDARLERRFKRRLVACRGLKGGKTKEFHSGVVDITDDDGPKDSLKEKGGGKLNEDDEKKDPRYPPSLKLLKSERCSYILGSPIGNSVMSLVRYEGDADICLHRRLAIPKSSPCCHKKGNHISGGSESSQNELHHVSVENHEYDDEYGRFLKNLKWEGDTMIYVDKYGKQLRYEDDDFTSSFGVRTNSIPSTAAKTKLETCLPPIVDVDIDCCQGTSSCSSDSSLFRDELLLVLEKPYDQEEYDKLIEAISVRKPLNRDRNLRGKIISYSVKSHSKSYLDHHKDLKGRIDICRHDRHKVLKLLRGFFYWIVNLAHEGSFKPWLDNKCF